MDPYPTSGAKVFASREGTYSFIKARDATRYLPVFACEYGYPPLAQHIYVYVYVCVYVYNINVIKICYLSK